MICTKFYYQAPSFAVLVELKVSKYCQRSMQECVEVILELEL
jgi:hypothetical protein